MNVRDLPTLNAMLNGLTAVLLVCGYAAIRRGKREVHQRFMTGAVTTSVLFLASYLTYHVGFGAQTRFPEGSWFRPYYLGILISHTVLAAVVVPMVLRTVYLASRRRFEEHRRLARWTLPVWMYVSFTGVLVYLLLYHFFAPGAVS
jgi:putative membrane protein